MRGRPAARVLQGHLTTSTAGWRRCGSPGDDRARLPLPGARHQACPRFQRTSRTWSRPSTTARAGLTSAGRLDPSRSRPCDEHGQRERGQREPGLAQRRRRGLEHRAVLVERRERPGRGRRGRCTAGAAPACRPPRRPRRRSRAGERQRPLGRLVDARSRRPSAASDARLAEDRADPGARRTAGRAPVLPLKASIRSQVEDVVLIVGDREVGVLHRADADRRARRRRARPRRSSGLFSRRPPRRRARPPRRAGPSA